MKNQPAETVALELIWAKSDARGATHSLPAHLLDAIAAAELIWDQYMAPGFRSRLNRCFDGRGREVFLLAAGWHDLGKATPAFQWKQPDLTVGLREQGALSICLDSHDRGWHHSHASRAILEERFRDLPQGAQWAWLAYLLEGHHGRFRDYGEPPPRAYGDSGWRTLQQRLCRWVEDQVGVAIGDIECELPPRSIQLELAGFVVMADWLASSNLLQGLGTTPSSLSLARSRVAQVWEMLGLRGGWTLPQVQTSFNETFGFAPRPLQTAVMRMAESMERPGLILVEAPMGEGKTEAALAAVEILARRFGCDGLAFAMPTQGTTDAMYDRCVAWAECIDPAFPVALVHGKAMMNEVWRAKIEQARSAPRFDGVYDEFGTRDDYGVSQAASPDPADSPAPSEWLLARHRALLSPGVVMTIDHLLYAGTKTPFVMLRHAGLSGKVVVIDEVHSYDIFTESFLDEVLAWLGQAEVPVILMSATLPPQQRERLLAAYCGGRLATPVTSQAGYPLVMSVGGCQGSQVRHAATLPWRQSLAVEVEVLGDASSGVDALASRILRDMAGGGCALAIVNTVGRSQQLARLLRDAGQEVLLIHGRLTARQRADRTQMAVDLLGRGHTRATGRPCSLVVVATQVAEQSFDVDVDILYTDLAPMDLLLQRIGRLFRHDRSPDDRPLNMRTPRVVISGVSLQAESCSYPSVFAKYVYDPYSLIRSAAALTQAGPWLIPDDVPRLVEEAYADTCGWVPASWAAEERAAGQEVRRRDWSRKHRAGSFLLSAGAGLDMDLRNLHYFVVAGGSDESVVVRDGEPTLEVCLVVSQGDHFETLGGSHIGPLGEAASSNQIALEVLGDTVRVRHAGSFAGLRPLPGWTGAPLLRWRPAMILEDNLTAEYDDCVVSYDEDYGLAVVWKGSRR